MRIRFDEIAHAITGFSTPFFGISWEPPESERETIRKLMIFLEDRRILYKLPTYGNSFIVESVLKIREELTKGLQQLNQDSNAVPLLRAMRAACRKFLDQMQWIDAQIERSRPDTGPESESRSMMYWSDVEVSQAHGELRGVFGIHIARLCVMYGIDLDGELGNIIPIPDITQSEEAG